MAYRHLTAAEAVTLDRGRINRVRIQVNTALTGTITVYDDVDEGTDNVVAVITNPTVGNVFEFSHLKNGFKVVPSATCDITVQTF